MPFDVLPNIIIKMMVINAVMLMNAHINKQGVSQIYSPREIVLRRNLDFGTHCTGVFGEYVLAYDDNNITNTMQERAISGIYVGSAGNMQGSVKVLSLSSGKVVKRRHITRLPMPDSVIEKINRWGKKNKRAGRGRYTDKSSFADRHNNEYDWNDEQLVHDNAPEPEEVAAKFPALPAETPGVDLERNMTDDTLPVVEDDTPSMQDRASAARENADLRSVRDIVDIPGVQGEIAGVAENANQVPAYDDEIVVETVEDSSDDDTFHTADGSVDSDDDVIPNEQEDTEEEEEEQELTDFDDEEVSVRRSTRPRQKPQTSTFNRKGDITEKEGYGESHISMNEEDDTPISIENDEVGIFGIIMLQVSIKQSYKLYGKERTDRGALKEVQQLHDLEVFFPRDPKSLTKEERIRALSSLIFMKEKHEGEDGMKGRACINGAPQREYIPKEDAASPTVNNDSVFITNAVGAYEGRVFATSDLPGAFCNTPLDDEVVIMALRGELCELMVRTDPKLYRKYVTTTKNGTPLLYVQLTKALYGLMRSALLFYRKLRKELEDYGFEFNPYDPCVCNKMVEMSVVENGKRKHVFKTDESGKTVVDKNGKSEIEMVQFTIVFHVDDLHMSCRNSFEITKFWSYINKLYNNNVKITRGHKHKFLGMDFDYSEKGVFKCTMIPYIKQIIEDFPEEIESSAPAPHTDYLFKIRDEGKRKLLEEERAKAFHHTVAQLLFLSQRARRDISPAVPFLTSRVKEPDEDDWGKVKRVLRYLKGTLHLPLRIQVESTEVPEWDIDASHAVHEDCKGQTGGGMTLGKGAAMAMSWKHKVNCRSSTEAEIVGLYDCLPNVLWCLYFMQAQGYGTKRARVNQDNNSAILLEVNGRASSSKRTKHLKNKYFYIKHCVDEGDIEIRKKDTNDMWCDMYTKPKTGTPYKKDRSISMNCPLEWPDETIHGPPSNIEKKTSKPMMQKMLEIAGRNGYPRMEFK